MLIHSTETYNSTMLAMLISTQMCRLFFQCRKLGLDVRNLGYYLRLWCHSCLHHYLEGCRYHRNDTTKTQTTPHIVTVTFIASVCKHLEMRQ